MAKQLLNLGSSANDGTGDTIRAGGDKINDNFNEIYSGTAGWLVRNVNYTAVAGDKLLVDCAAAARTITLPTSANVGEEVTIVDAKGASATNNITVNRNGHNIKGSAVNASITTAYGVRNYVYESATKGWVDHAGGGSGGTTLTNDANNRVTTATGGGGVNGEANLTFDGSTLAVTGAATISTTLGVTGVTTLSEDVTFTGAANNVHWDKSANTLFFADNAKLHFGTGNDLQIWHDGTHSRISDVGTGDIKLAAANLEITDISNYSPMATFADGGAVALYFNATNALQTTATGLQVNRGIVDVKNVGTASSIKLYCETANSHNVEIKSPAHAGFSGGSWTMTLPGVNGDPGGVLQTNGAGVTSWATWTAISSATTAVAGGKYLVNTSSAAVTLTLPASPAAGAEVTVLDANKTFDTNALTIGRGGQPINGNAADLTVSTESAGFTLVYSNATQGWLYKEV